MQRYLRTGIAVPLLALAKCSGSPADPVPVAGDVYVDDADEFLCFGNAALELRFDRATGELRGITYRPKNLAILDNSRLESGADLNVDGDWLSAVADPTAQSPWRFEAMQTEKLEEGGALHITSAIPGWKLRATYRLWPGKAVVERSAAFIPDEGTEGRLSGVRLALRGLRAGDSEETVYAHLSNYPPERVPLADLTPGRTVGEYHSGTSGHFVMLHNSRERISVPVTYFSRQESSSAHVIEGDSSISVIGHQAVLCDVQPGKEVDFGSQLLCVAESDWHDGLRAGQSLYEFVGLRPPERTYELAAKTVMYSAHPGGTIDSGFQDVGSYREFAKLLPYMNELGVNVLWLLPVWHGNVYAPDDYYALDPRLGTEEELKALVDRAHDLGIRVLLDLIPHGPLDRTGFHEQHPELISRKEDGSLLYWWGCLSCDYAHPGWQKYMADHAAYWVKQVGVDGYRVDCAMGGPPNWRPYGDNRPSMSGLYGGLGVLAAARAEMEQVKPEILLLPEAGGPALFESGNYAYNWTFYFGVLSRLPDEGAGTWVPRASEWLEHQRYTFPRGARQLMFLENHDLPRAILRFGVGTQKALLALCAFGDWTPFLYHDQEIGYGPYLRRLYAIRAAHEELTLGEASYTAIRSNDPRVFTILRTHNGRNVVAAVNFGGREAACTLDLTACPGLDDQTRYGLWDCFRERRIDGEAGGLLPSEMRAVPVALDPYSSAVILVRPPAELPALAKTDVAEPALRGRAPGVERDGDRVTVSNGICRLQIGPDAGGLIEELVIGGQGVAMGPTAFGSRDRRLWLGGDVSLGPEALQSVEVAEREGEVEVISRGTVTRLIGGQLEPALEYEARHLVDSSPSVGVSLRLTPRINITDVLGSLATVLPFPEAGRWTANTLEGLLHDDVVARRSADEPHHRMYAHPHSDRLYASQSIPLDPVNGFIGAEWSDDRVLFVEGIRGWESGVPRYVMLKERLKESEGLHGLIVWADGTRPLTLKRGETYELSYTLRVASGGERAMQLAAAEGRSPSRVRLRADGCRYSVETATYRAALVSSKGGSLAEFARPDSPPGIGGSNVYSDYGIYGEWTDPLGRKNKTNASSNVEPDPDVAIQQEEDRLTVAFSGRLRHPHGFGRGVISPVTQHRTTYEFGPEPVIGVECTVRPHLTKKQVSAFLAQTMSLPGAQAWATYARDQLLASGTGAPPEKGDRVWESAVAKIAEEDEPSLIVELPGPTCVRFSEFGGLEDVQNLFLTRGSGGGMLFVAFLDGQPEDIAPAWRTVRYRIALHDGTIGDVAGELGLALPRTGGAQ